MMSKVYALFLTSGLREDDMGGVVRREQSGNAKMTWEELPSASNR